MVASGLAFGALGITALTVYLATALLYGRALEQRLDRIEHLLIEEVQGQVDDSK